MMKKENSMKDEKRTTAEERRDLRAKEQENHKKVAAELPTIEENHLGGTEEEERVYNLFCENCGCRFQSENPSKRFHSPSCASLFINRKRMEERDRG